MSGIPASVISDMDAPMRSLGGRTVPDGAVGILPAFMMIVAGCHYMQYLSIRNSHIRNDPLILDSLETKTH